MSYESIAVGVFDNTPPASCSVIPQCHPALIIPTNRSRSVRHPSSTILLEPYLRLRKMAAKGVWYEPAWVIDRLGVKGLAARQVRLLCCSRAVHHRGANLKCLICACHNICLSHYRQWDFRSSCKVPRNSSYNIASKRVYR